VNLPLLVPHSPTLSPQTAREILGLVIRLNVEASAIGARTMEGTADA
jgi:hypothetical protein